MIVDAPISPKNLEKLVNFYTGHRYIYIAIHLIRQECKPLTRLHNKVVCVWLPERPLNLAPYN